MPGRFRQPAPRAPRAPRPAPAEAGDRSSAAIADRLHSAAIHLLRSLREADRRLGLSAPRLSALSVLVFRGPLSMSDLARAEQVRKPTITRLVGELERAGLVTRSRSEKDRRVQTV
ncbi:MAG TPA: MarR family transcriptional regulator, partial [Gemmatimonadales bacterium]|nr:MarR family transcriptional regulator [Gemmatimonadales bacterium]